VIKVLLADNHDIVRAGLRRIVEECADMEVVAEVAESREALAQIQKTLPDVVIIEISMSGLDGLELLRQVYLHFPQIPILILTIHEEEQYLTRALAAGAKGYLTKRSTADQLLKAIRKVHAGERYLSEAAVESLAWRMARGEQGRSPVDSLSSREIQVLRYLALGHTVREIATAYNLSHKTVHSYRLALLKKLNLRNNAEISRFAIQNRLVEC
jgi:DNA-binding NarL/FixJ family response regulator